MPHKSTLLHVQFPSGNTYHVRGTPMPSGVVLITSNDWHKATARSKAPVKLLDASGNSYTYTTLQTGGIAAIREPSKPGTR